MMRYKDFQPTGFDPKGLYLSDRQEWFVAPVMFTRDSGPLSQSNFEACLEALGGEGKNVEVHRFNHWGPGWFEIILVYPMASSKVKILEDIEASLADYPSLDDEKLSELEQELKIANWQTWADSEVLDLYHTITKLPKEDCEIEIDTDAAREACWEAMDIDNDGSSCIFRNEVAFDCLKNLPYLDFWLLLKLIKIKPADFSTLPHDLYHMLYQANVEVLNIDTGRELRIPDFISVQYDSRQLKIPT